ncbi:hypothetical protein [Microbispora hainanensis]|uniref:Uncharacterized protein n=1 Tax=Microbispora hainanensis TaxID=568844 RepID=A0A544YKA3_9ACTN|nr:hypothetical protein [Microbispora hainanensis]TQS17171.1 hypothetical protein FLX08_30560 [Microbispora hainanensis]
MKHLPLWRHELRRAGWTACAAPAAALAVTLALTATAAAFGTARPQLERFLLTGLEALIPLAAGMAAVAVVSRDPSRELQLTLPTPYTTTLGRRLAVLGGLTATLAIAFSAALAAGGWWTGPGLPYAPLVWAAPLLWLTGLALLVAALGRSVVLATTTVAAIWLGEQLFAATFATTPGLRPFFLFMTTRIGVPTDWDANRAALAASGALLTALALMLLRRPERLLTEEET